MMSSCPRSTSPGLLGYSRSIPFSASCANAAARALSRPPSSVAFRAVKTPKPSTSTSQECMPFTKMGNTDFGKPDAGLGDGPVASVLSLPDQKALVKLQVRPPRKKRNCRDLVANVENLGRLVMADKPGIELRSGTVQFARPLHHPARFQRGDEQKLIFSKFAAGGHHFRRRKPGVIEHLELGVVANVAQRFQEHGVGGRRALGLEPCPYLPSLRLNDPLLLAPLPCRRQKQRSGEQQDSRCRAEGDQPSANGPKSRLQDTRQDQERQHRSRGHVPREQLNAEQVKGRDREGYGQGPGRTAYSRECERQRHDGDQHAADVNNEARPAPEFHGIGGQ